VGVANPYTPAGDLWQYQLGNNLWETRSYDPLLRWTGVSLGATKGGAERFQTGQDSAITDETVNIAQWLDGIGELKAAAVLGPSVIAKLARLGTVMDRNALTIAGRSLVKHGARPARRFPRVTGSASNVNAAGQTILEEILNNADKLEPFEHITFGHVLDVIDSAARRGARFTADFKTFIGFLDK
jgi:hypothetical protein